MLNPFFKNVGPFNIERLLSKIDIKNKDFNQFRANSQKKIIEALNPIITAFLKNESVQILLQKEQIIFGDNKLDITEKILKLFNAKHKRIKFD